MSFSCLKYFSGPSQTVSKSQTSYHDFQDSLPSNSRLSFMHLRSSCVQHYIWCLLQFLFVCFISLGLGLGCCVGCSVAAESGATRRWSAFSWRRPYCKVQPPGARALGLGRRLSSCRDTGSVAPQHVGSSRIRDQTRVSCLGRRTPYHWATGKPPVRCHRVSSVALQQTGLLAFPYVCRVPPASRAPGPLHDCLFLMHRRSSALTWPSAGAGHSSYPVTSPYLSFS